MLSVTNKPIMHCVIMVSVIYVECRYAVRRGTLSRAGIIILLLVYNWNNWTTSLQTFFSQALIHSGRLRPCLQIWHFHNNVKCFKVQIIGAMTFHQMAQTWKGLNVSGRFINFNYSETGFLVICEWLMNYCKQVPKWDNEFWSTDIYCQIINNQ